MFIDCSFDCIFDSFTDSIAYILSILRVFELILMLDTLSSEFVLLSSDFVLFSSEFVLSMFDDSILCEILKLFVNTTSTVSIFVLSSCAAVLNLRSDMYIAVSSCSV